MQQIDMTQKQDGEELAEDAELIELTAGDEEAPGAAELAGELERTAEEFNVRGFKCTKCGLAHGHDTDKHRGSDSFSMTHEEAGDMEFNPNCHCGYNDIAHNGGQYGVSDGPSPSSAGDTAPVPPHVEKQLRS